MKAKYLVYLVIISFILRIGMNLVMPLLLLNLKIEPITLGLIGGIINVLIFLSVAGLLIKIFRYHNKVDFLNK